MSSFAVVLWVAAILVSGKCNAQLRRPHIIFILIDDLGWNDVSFRGSTDIQTPNIDALAADGVLLNNYYVYPICSPSRSAILTGRYASNIGMQHYVIRNAAPWGLPLDLVTLPQYLRPLGYSTVLVGKWHLGYHRTEYTPLQRGFDYHYGYWQATMDYFQHISIIKANVAPNDTDLSKCGINKESFFMNGSALIDNETLVKDRIGEYSTDIFNQKTQEVINNHTTSKPLFLYLSPTAVHRGNFFRPMKSPDSYSNLFNHIKNETRRNFAGALFALDKLVGDVIKVLHDREMLSNSIIVVSSDNGADSSPNLHNGGSNWPLRGEKFTAFEGGVRTLGLVWSPLLNGKVDYNHLIHASDWLPTLYSAAGGDVATLDLVDGVNLWDVLGTTQKGARTDVLIDCDNVSSRGAYRNERFKLIYGDYGFHTYDWHSPSSQLDGVHIRQESTIQEILKLYQHCGTKPIHRNHRVNCGFKMDAPSLSCAPNSPVCLFDLLNDPCEYHNLASQYPEIVSSMLFKMKQYVNTSYPALYRPLDPEASPKLYGGDWVPWLDPQYEALRSTFPESYKDNLCTEN